MNWVKPIVRIQLVSQVKGPDYWRAVGVIGTSEGQCVLIERLRMEKSQALSEVYRAITLCMRHNTLSYKAAYQQQLVTERFEKEAARAEEERLEPAQPGHTVVPVIRENTPFSRRKQIAEDLHEKGVITQYQFNEWSRKHFEGECPFPQKWKWYHWLWNPTD